LEHVTSRLNSWGNKFLSFGGRIVLLNSVLNAIPIFYLSFLRMSMKVWKRLVRIQREFLWGGVGGGKKNSWVKWSKVCQPKEKRGLGIRDIRLVNLSLLAKWRWRILHGDGALWIEVLKEKYGGMIEDLLETEIDHWPRFVSKWWKDIVTLDHGGGGSWFNVEVIRRVGNGQNTSFWNAKWRGDTTFKIKYPRLYAISNQKEAKVADFLVFNGFGTEWNFSWRRRLFVWEEELINNLMLDIQGFDRAPGEDEWVWKLEDGGRFSVSSTYKKLEEALREEEEWGEVECRVFGQIWKSPAPTKAVALSWKGLINRIPTRENLARRNALPINVNLNCVVCGMVEETTNHLFLHCTEIWKVWKRLESWLEVNITTPSNLFLHWMCWEGQMANWKELERGMRLVWHSAIWVIWNSRNEACLAFRDLGELERIGKGN